jgi:hypothetical protein
MIKTGLIGHGYWGKIIESKLDSISQKRFVQTTANYDATVFNEVDWIFIATPVETHYKIAKDCIERGVNVFVEKPFCTNLIEAEELVLLGQKNQVNLYVDNVFLRRKELLNNKTRPSKSIKFCWYKYGPFNDNLVNDLLYHDLYLLISILGLNEISSLNLILNEKDILQFNFLYAGIEIEIDYNRVSHGKKEKIIYLDGVPINFGSVLEDPLKQILLDCLSGSADFKSNNFLNLQTMAMMDVIKQNIILF